MKRRGAIALIVAAALLLAAALSLRWAMRPDVLGPQVLALTGQALGLEISADSFDYRLRGSPQLTARGVAAREPGAATPVLTAERVMVSIPWSTLRARGADPVATRIELDAPHLDLAAFRRWWDARVPGEGPLPTLREGLRVIRGRIDGAGWALQDIRLDLPHFAPGAPLRAAVAGRYAGTGTLQAPFDLQIVMTRPAGDAGLGIAGVVAPRDGDWRLPMRVQASARVAATAAATELRRLRLSARALYRTDQTVQPFAFGLAAQGRVSGGAAAFEPLSLDLRGQDMIPRLRGSGRLAFDEALSLALEGAMADWPGAWPALPPPIGDAPGPFPFALQYQGTADLSAPIALQLRHDGTTFDGRLRIAALTEWIAASAAGTPLPPLDGRLQAPRLDLPGASLHGVEILIRDEPPGESPP